MLSGSAAVAIETPDPAYERRSEERFTDLVERAVITFRGQDYPVSVINISSRGTQIECDFVPRLGENLVIQFECCSRMQGFVRWAREGKLGIRFGHEIILAA
jgi:hypothetical protein